MLTVDEVVASIPPGEDVLAVGVAQQIPVVVTSNLLLRAGTGAAVVIPLDSIHLYEHWREAHRWAVRLFHDPVDPHRPAREASQWWRWHDRRKLRRLWTLTELTFSSEHTAVADALREVLARRATDVRESPPRTTDRIGLRGHLGGVD